MKRVEACEDNRAIRAGVSTHIDVSASGDQRHFAIEPSPRVHRTGSATEFADADSAGSGAGSQHFLWTTLQIKARRRTGMH